MRCPKRDIANISGGLPGEVPYQTAPSITSFIPANSGVLTSDSTTPLFSNGITGEVLTATTGLRPSFAAIPLQQNLPGGSAGKVPYQTSPSITSFTNSSAGVLVSDASNPSFINGTTGQVLTAVTGAQPTFTSAPSQQNIPGGNTGTVVYQTAVSATGFTNSTIGALVSDAVTPSFVNGLPGQVLVANAVGIPPSFQTLPFTPPNARFFNTVGAFTYTPAATVKYINVKIAGGGGGGGGGNTNTSQGTNGKAGGGGGGGAVVEMWSFAISLAGAIGGGGAGGAGALNATAGNGVNGTSSTVTSLGITATGGSAGSGASGTGDNGAAGGRAIGVAGASAIMFLSSAGGVGNDKIGAFGGGNQLIGFTRGSRQVATPVAQLGQDGSRGGSGGAGGMHGGNGGAGGPGCVVIIEYYQ